MIEKKITDFSSTSNSYTRRNIFDRKDIILEIDQNNNIVAAYLHGPGTDEPIAMLRDENRNGQIDPNEIFIYTKDHLGSVKDITDMNGSLIQRYHYSAYGITKVEKDDHNRPNIPLENPYAYTSREFVPELGIYYYRARWYWPIMQRFVSLDPIGFKAGDTNFYRYVGNNPVLYADPLGLKYRTCTRPLSFLDDQHGRVYHEYIEFDSGEVYSFGPTGNPLTNSPSQNTTEDGSTSTCGEYSKDSSRDAELKRKAREKLTEDYNLFNYNCQDYVSDVLGN